MMNSHQVSEYNVTNPDPLYFSAQLTIPPMPSRMFGSLKLNSRGSPVSPFSNHLDCDMALNDSLDHHSSTGSLCTRSPSCNSLLETSSYPHPSTKSPSKSIGETSNYHGLFNLSPSRDNHQSPDYGMGMKGALQKSSSHSGGTRWGDERRTEKRHKAMEETIEEPSLPPSDLKQLLIDCARALSDDRIADFERLVEQARKVVSISGEPIQRLGAYMIEGLIAKKECSGTSIYRALKCTEPLGKDLLSYMPILYEICPYYKFGYMAANGAIAEACRNEDNIHIIDFQIAQGSQWVTLLQALAARPGGPPKVRITGINDPLSKYARGTSLEAVGKRLASLSKRFKIPVEFNALPVYGPHVRLDVRPGEALAVNFPLQLHHTPDESVDVNNPRDGLLRMVKSLNPKVTTLVEQESNTNTTAFLTRFIETMEYYSAMFESIDVTMDRDQKERIHVEQHCLAKDIVNIIACEDKERVERHELFGKWRSRFTMAGFRQYPLSSYVNSVIRNLLRCYSEEYTLIEKDGAMLLGWKDRMLISASAWH